MSFSIIGGVEQSSQSSLPSATNPFLRIFTSAGPDKSPIRFWAYVRILGAPQASSTSGVISAVTDPAGNITTQTFSGIGTSVDFMIGGQYDIQPGRHQYAVSLIAGYGGTTPLTANSLNQAYKALALGTVECPTLQSRFIRQFAADNIIAGTSTNAAMPEGLRQACHPQHRQLRQRCPTTLQQGAPRNILIFHGGRPPFHERKQLYAE